jgi:diguanylate cyclase (GGDEF)-like protein/PAS domain S-box-containing protein
LRTDLRYQALFDRSNDAIFLIDLNRIFSAVNQKTTEFLGYGRAELIGMSIEDITAPEEAADAEEKGRRILAGEILPAYERTFIRKDGFRVVGEVSVSLVYNPAGEPEFVQSIVRDVTQRKIRQQVLWESQNRYRALFDQTNDGITLIDLEGVIFDANPRAAEILGMSVEELVGRRAEDFIAEDENDNSLPIHQRLLNGEILPIYERTLIKKAGARVPVEINVALVKDQDGKPLYVQSITRDISERKQIEEKLEHWSTHDWLTGLPNRFLFYDRLQKSIARAKRYQRKFAVLYIDLNGFKNVNDTHGHAAGDQLLVQVARRLQGCSRQSDTVARMGGDEFIMLVEEITSAESAAAAAERVLDAVNQEFKLNQTDRVKITASIGISLFPDHGEQDDILVSCADRALYENKKSTTSGYSIFS